MEIPNPLKTLNLLNVICRYIIIIILIRQAQHTLKHEYKSSWDDMTHVHTHTKKKKR